LPDVTRSSDSPAEPGQLEGVLGYRFAERDRLRQALTHRSAGVANNERLEFLGDSVINHIVAESIYHRFPGATEGEMSRMRASLVKGATLARIDGELGRGGYRRLGPGERRSGGHRRPSILADCLEALAGAILLDGGMTACRTCVLAWFESRLQAMDPADVAKDAKTSLQEYLQSRGHPLPTYELVQATGQEHQQTFHVNCRVEGLGLVREGQGSSRRKAEQAAARRLLQELSGDD